MTVRKTLLDALEITSPCNANWDEMAGTDQVRYCSECDKYVYNLSSMTQLEAESLVAGQRGRMCARMIRDAAGRTMTVNSLPPVRLMSWRPGPVASAVVSAMITLAPGASALARDGKASSRTFYSLDGSGRKAIGDRPGKRDRFAHRSSDVSRRHSDDGGPGHDHQRSVR